ncbi:MAG: hypothetical protein ABIV43_01360 [Candidatus Saccharimonadales bacterium]
MKQYQIPSPQPLGALINLGEIHTVAYQLQAELSKQHVVEHLRQRHLLGVLARHGATQAISGKYIEKARALHVAGELGVFVLSDETNAVVGMGTVDPSARLRRQRVQMLPWLARGPVAYDIALHGPQVTAWVAPSEGQMGRRILTAAYRELANPDGVAAKFHDKYQASSAGDDDARSRAWTIEPLDAADWVRASIRDAGFQRLDTGYYDDGQSRRVEPPRATLYQA